MELITSCQRLESSFILTSCLTKQWASMKWQSRITKQISTFGWRLWQILEKLVSMVTIAHHAILLRNGKHNCLIRPKNLLQYHIHYLIKRILHKLMQTEKELTKNQSKFSSKNTIEKLQLNLMYLISIMLTLRLTSSGMDSSASDHTLKISTINKKTSFGNWRTIKWSTIW